MSDSHKGTIVHQLLLVGVYSFTGNATVVVSVPGHEYVALQAPVSSCKKKKKKNSVSLVHYNREQTKRKNRVWNYSSK